MSGTHHHPAASTVAFGIALLLVGACIPSPAGGATQSPTTGLQPSTVAVTTPTPTAVPSGPPAPPSFVRPTPTPLPTFLSYVVKSGDTLDSIAEAHGTTARSIAFWNRSTYPSLDPDSSAYAPDRIKIGWVLLLVPDIEIDEDQTFP
jgi:nucleoid-associated protein YgaU